MRKITFEGVEIEYDEKCLKSWKWQKAIASGDTARAMGAFEKLLCGKDEEIADALGDSSDKMQELIIAIVDGEAEAKN